MEKKENTLNLLAVKQLLASFLLFFFSLQVFPVLEIGKVLSKQQVLEETGELETGTDDFGGKLKKDDRIQLLSLTKDNVRARQYTIAVATALQNTETLPLFFIPDILTPPPNGGQS